MYTNKGSLSGAGTTSALSLTSAANIARHAAADTLDITQIAFVVKTATVSTGGIVLTFYDRPVMASSSNQVTIGTITIPGGTAAGAYYYKKVEYKLLAGHLLEVDVTTAAAGSGAAGDGVPVVQLGFSSEDERNISVAVASA